VRLVEGFETFARQEARTFPLKWEARRGRYQSREGGTGRRSPFAEPGLFARMRRRVISTMWIGWMIHENNFYALHLSPR